jgi:transposase InsO family protein
MEAVPLSTISVVNCTQELVFHWITCFGVPDTITSDWLLQFTSNPWVELCDMLSILHCQTTAYHPVVNGAVKRLHRRLKDSLRVRSTAATWAEVIP